MDTRDSIDVFYMKMAYLISERSTCIKRKVGSIIVKDKIVLSTGYNGVPIGLPHCTIQNCLRLNANSGEKSNNCRAAHAEQNAIVWAAKNGIAIDNSTLYCTTQPCITCAKMIANTGIKRVVFHENYSKGFDDLTKFILQNVKVDQINMDTQKIITLIGG